MMHRCPYCAEILEPVKKPWVDWMCPNPSCRAEFMEDQITTWEMEDEENLEEFFKGVKKIEVKHLTMLPKRPDA